MAKPIPQSGETDGPKRKQIGIAYPDCEKPGAGNMPGHVPPLLTANGLDMRGGRPAVTFFTSAIACAGEDRRGYDALDCRTFWSEHIRTLS